MATIKTDHTYDLNIEKAKKSLVLFQTQLQSFIGAHKHMPPKERTKNYLALQKSTEELSRVFSQIRASSAPNSASKFAATNLAQTYQAVLGRWRNFEKTYLG